MLLPGAADTLMASAVNRRTPVDSQHMYAENATQHPPEKSPQHSKTCTILRKKKRSRNRDNARSQFREKQTPNQYRTCVIYVFIKANFVRFTHSSILISKNVRQVPKATHVNKSAAFLDKARRFHPSSIWDGVATE